jgi:hypothetical protein
MYFVSAGCSYSQVPNTDITWPVHVQKAFNLDDDHVRHLGIGAIGNEMISKLVIYNVNDLLKTHKPEDLLVGIMWSGCDRHLLTIRESERVYSKATKLGLPESYSEIDECKPYRPRNYFQSPTKIACEEYNYYTLNCHWNDELTINYYNRFVDPLGSLISTCEHILRTEWFLKQHNIKYFMCAYDFDTFMYAGIPGPNIGYGYDEDCPALQINSNKQYDTIDHPDVKYLYDMIDKTYWLPITDLRHWVKNVSKFDFRDPTDPHPSTEQHIDFTKQIILPFLEKIYNITPVKLP